MGSKIILQGKVKKEARFLPRKGATGIHDAAKTKSLPACHQRPAFNLGGGEKSEKSKRKKKKGTFNARSFRGKKQHRFRRMWKLRGDVIRKKKKKKNKTPKPAGKVEEPTKGVDTVFQG